MRRPNIVSKCGEHAYTYWPGARLIVERLVADELDLGRREPRAGRLAAEHEVVDVGEVVDEELVAAFGEDVDVLPVRVGEIDREARARPCRRAASRPRSPPAEPPRASGRRQRSKIRRTPPGSAPAYVQSTDSLKRESQRRGLTRRAAAPKVGRWRFASSSPRAAGRRRRLRLLAAARDASSACTCSRSRSTTRSSTAGCARCARCPRRCGARSRRSRSSTAGRCPTASCPPPTRATTTSRSELAPRSPPAHGRRRLRPAAAGLRPRRRRAAAEAPHPRVAGRARGRAEARRDARPAGHAAPPRCSSTIPPALVERFASLLEAYWEEAFAAEWERIEPKLAESVELAGRQIAGDGMYAFLLTLAPQLRVDPGGRSFGLDVPHDHRVPITPEEPAAARSERLRVAARAGQLRRAVAAVRRLPRAAPRREAAARDAAASSSSC